VLKEKLVEVWRKDISDKEIMKFELNGMSGKGTHRE
jgi:hypothetical protein